MFKRLVSLIVITLLTASVALGDWTMYQRDASHTAYIPITKMQAATEPVSLNAGWTFATGGWVSGTPLVSDGTVYAGSWDGHMYALREKDGSTIWSLDAGTTIDQCGETYGIDGTAALSDGKLYFGAANCQLYCVDAATGQVIWQVQLADPDQGFHLWSSPLVYNGKLYVGLASHCDTPCVRGQIICVSIRDGSVMWTFYTAPEGSTGGGVWSSLAADSALNLVYATSGNFCDGDDTYSDSILALQADTGGLNWVYKNINRDSEDLDFGASPVLFEANGVPALAAGSKDGHCYALNRSTGQLLWDSMVTDGGAEGGIISSPAAAFGMIFMGASMNEENGKIVALDQRDGHVVWESQQPAPVYAPATVAGNVLFIGGLDGVLHAFEATSGSELWTARIGPIFCGVSFSENRFFVGGVDSKIHSFNIGGPRISAETVPSGKVGQPYSASLHADSGGAVAWSLAAGNLPPGLELSMIGDIAGVPTADGTFEFTVHVSDDQDLTASADVQIVIDPGETIKVTSPSAGDSWDIGSKYTVSWSSTAGVSQVDISISRDGGSTWSTLFSNVPASMGQVRTRAKKPKSQTAVIRVVSSSDGTVLGRTGVFQIQ